MGRTHQGLLPGALVASPLKVLFQRGNPALGCRLFAQRLRFTGGDHPFQGSGFQHVVARDRDLERLGRFGRSPQTGFF